MMIFANLLAGPNMVWSVLSYWIDGYESSLEAAPVLTKALTSATVYTLGDVIAQRTEGAKQLDLKRVLRSLIAGGCGHGPMSHLWYHFSESFFQDVLHWTFWWVFLPKVCLDQVLWGPFWNNAYIIILGVLKRESVSNIYKDIRRTTVPLIVSGLKLWLPCHCITYGVIGVENRLLWVDIVEILWVTILATQAAGKTKAKRVKQPKQKKRRLRKNSAALTLSPRRQIPLVRHDTPDSSPVPSPMGPRGSDQIHQTNVHRSAAKDKQQTTTESATGYSTPAVKHLQMPEIKVHYS